MAKVESVNWKVWISMSDCKLVIGIDSFTITDSNALILEKDGEPFVVFNDWVFMERVK